jgi:Aldehyde oxidase and xanthine dehydrogenase, a/b hammerhead domain
MNAPTALKNLLPVSGVQQGTDIVHESAHLHVTGSATYIDDIPEHAGTLYAALILSPVAHGELIGDGIDREAILKEHGVVAVYTAKDIPGENNCGPIVHDDPFLAAGKVEFVGQAVAVVVARDMLYAREAAQGVGERTQAHLDGGRGDGSQQLHHVAQGYHPWRRRSGYCQRTSQNQRHHTHRPARTVLSGMPNHLRGT